MAAKDPRVDAYIGRAADFARPILNHLRRLVHAACPEAEETMKWRFPHFDYKGMMCSMAAFKQHCVFGFWKGALIFAGGRNDSQDEAMGHFGRITSLTDLPAGRQTVDRLPQAGRTTQQNRRQAAREVPAESDEGAGDPGPRHRGVEKEQAGPGDVRELQLHPQKGVCGMAHRGQARGDAPTAIEDCHSVDGSREAEELEVSMNRF